MLHRQALRPVPQGGNVPAALGLSGRLQGQPHAARQVRPQSRQQLGAKRLFRQDTDQHGVLVRAVRQPKKDCLQCSLHPPTGMSMIVISPLLQMRSTSLKLCGTSQCASQSDAK